MCVCVGGESKLTDNFLNQHFRESRHNNKFNKFEKKIQSSFVYDLLDQKVLVGDISLQPPPEGHI